MRFFDSAHPGLPQSAFDHPLAHRLIAHFDAMSFGELFAGEGGPEIVPVRLFQKLDRPLLRLCGDLPVRGSTPQSMHCHRIALLLHSLQKLPHPSVAHADIPGRLPLADQPVTGPL
jgi:hypothetical protein